MNSEADRLIDQFKRAHDGDPWHGSPVMEILEGVTAAQAAQRPPNGAHSIWELVLHMTGWRNEVARRATGNAGRRTGGRRLSRGRRSDAGAMAGRARRARRVARRTW